MDAAATARFAEGIHWRIASRIGRHGIGPHGNPMNLKFKKVTVRWIT